MQQRDSISAFALCSYRDGGGGGPLVAYALRAVDETRD